MRMTFGDPQNKDSISCSAQSGSSVESNLWEGSSGNMVWETNVIAHDEDQMMKEEAVEERV